MKLNSILNPQTKLSNFFANLSSYIQIMILSIQQFNLVSFVTLITSFILFSVRNGEIFYDQTDQVQRKDFPNPFFEELANGRTDLLSEKSDSPSIFSSTSEGRPLSSMDGIESMDM